MSDPEKVCADSLRFRSQFGLLVLDDLHNLMEVTRVGSATFSSQSLLYTLSTLLASKMQSGTKHQMTLGDLWEFVQCWPVLLERKNFP